MNFFFTDKTIVVPENISYIDNITIFIASQLADFMGYIGDDLYLYEYIRYLARKAFYNDDTYQKLEDLSKHAKSYLDSFKEQYSLYQKDFQNIIRLKN